MLRLLMMLFAGVLLLLSLSSPTHTHTHTSSSYKNRQRAILFLAITTIFIDQCVYLYVSFTRQHLLAADLSLSIWLTYIYADNILVDCLCCWFSFHIRFFRDLIMKIC